MVFVVSRAKLATSTESDGGEGPQIQIATFPSRNIPDLRRKSQHGVDESLQQASGRGSSTGSHSTNGLTEPRSETEYVTLFTDRRPSASGSQIDYSQPSVKSGTSSHFEARVKTVANVKAVWGSMAVKLSLDNDEDDSVMSSNITDSVLSRGNIENPQSLEVLFGGHVSDEETDIDDRLSVSSAAEPQVCEEFEMRASGWGVTLVYTNCVYFILFIYYRYHFLPFSITLFIYFK